jgi:hypothetical protein
MSKRTENIILWTLLVLSFTAIGLIKFAWADVPEKWKYGHETGEIVYDLSLAYIASWIFYIVVVVVPKTRNEKNINSHTSRIVDSIVYTGNGLLHGLSSTIDDREREMTEDEVLALCNRIGPDSIQDLFITVTEKYPITYLQHINSVRERVKTESQKLFIYISHLDSELIRLTNDIVYCQLMVHLDIYFQDKQYRHPTFENISSALYDFYKKIRRLKEYRQKNM